MKLDRLILPLIAALALGASACEETVSADDVPYVEQVIVQGMLNADSTRDVIRFVRTLPLNESYDPQKAELYNVVGEITESKTGAVYKLIPIARGSYVAEGLRPVAGRRYTLTAMWKNDNGTEYHVTGSTTVPEQPRIIDVYAQKRLDTNFWIDDIPQQGYYVEAAVSPVPNVGYGMRYQVITGTSGGMKMGPSYSYQYDETMKRIEDTTAGGWVRLKPGDWSGSFYEEPPKPASVIIYAFDRSYYDYFMTRFANNDDQVFGAPAERTRWNVDGDGFGLFTSRNSTTWQGLVELK